MISWAVVFDKKAHRRNLASPSPTVTHSEPLPIDTISPCACIQAAPHLLPGRPACPSTVPRRWSINGSIWLSLFFLSFPSPAFPREQIIEGNKRGPVLYIAETASLPPDLGEPGLVDGGREVIYQCLDPPFSRSSRSVSVCFVRRQASFPPDPLLSTQDASLHPRRRRGAPPPPHRPRPGRPGQRQNHPLLGLLVRPVPSPQPPYPHLTPLRAANPPAPGPKRATTPTPSSPATRTTTRSTTAATQSPGATTAATPSCAAASPRGPSATRSRTAGPPSTSRASRSRRGAARATS